MRLASVLLAAICAAAVGSKEAMAVTTVAQSTVFEAPLESAQTYVNPPAEVSVRILLTGPKDTRRSVEAFWDGDRAWRFRFAPDVTGQWRWRSECSNRADQGLHGRRGTFVCTAYRGDNPVFARGSLKLSENRRHIVDAAGKPFFWLADTAWNGVLRASEEDWDFYLKTRREQGFTVVQFVCTHWRGLTKDAYGETACTGGQPIRINPAFFQRLDRKVAMVNESGLVGAPVVLWALGEGDPGFSLTTEDATLLARYIVARWGAHQVVWLLGGDGNFGPQVADKWRHIGRTVFAERHDRLVTLHPCGRHWPVDQYREEFWYDLVGYQSSHSAGEDTMRWLCQGPPAVDWRRAPPRPFINLEPNYEAHPPFDGRKQPFTHYEVRRAVYWSLLNAPTAGVTYGHNWIWPWHDAPAVPEGHGGLGVVGPWREAIQSPGTQSMVVLRRFFSGIEWWRLRPAQELLAEQPGEREAKRFIMAAASEKGELAVVYTPIDPVLLRAEGLRRPIAAIWFDPRKGQTSRAGEIAQGVTRFEPPGEGDWILCLRAK